MKQCPTCHTAYDDSLFYCLPDGPALVPHWPEKATLVSPPPSGSGRTANYTQQPAPAYNTSPTAKSGINPFLIAAVIALSLLVLAGVVIIGLSLNRQPANTVAEVKTTPTQNPISVDEAAKLRNEIANLQKQMEQKNAKPAINPQPAQPVTGGTSAWANSPSDGFLALRSQPSSEAGTRITKIPHGSQITIGSCQEVIITPRGNRGRWCQAAYN